MRILIVKVVLFVEQIIAHHHFLIPMIVAQEPDVTGVIFYSVTNIACSGSTCTFDNESYNGEQSAGNTLDIAFLYSFASSTAVISDVSITSEATAFCSS